MMYPAWDTFKFVQGHVITNQPMTIVFRARETAGVLQCGIIPLSLSRDYSPIFTLPLVNSC